MPKLVFCPTNDEVNYSYSKRSTENTCKYKNDFNTGSPFHYHVLIENEKLCNEQRKVSTSKSLSVPSLFTCFKELTSNLKDYVAVGLIMAKLTSAVFYNKYHNLELPGQRSRNRIPHVQSHYKRSQRTQTN